MDLKLWEYIFEMFNYKIIQKKIDFFKITNPYPALKAMVTRSHCVSRSAGSAIKAVFLALHSVTP